MEERREVSEAKAQLLNRREAERRGYVTAYESWIEGLTEAERAALPADLKKPLLYGDLSFGGRGGAPAAESTHAGFVVRVTENHRTHCEEAVEAETHEDSIADQLREVADLDAEQAEAVAGWVEANARRIAIEEASDFLAAFLENIIPAEGKIRLQIVAQKTIALRFMIGRRKETLTALAGRCELSKQLLCHHGRTLEAELGERFHGILQKRKGAVINFASAMRESWRRLTGEERRARRRGKKNATPEADTQDEHLTLCDSQNEKPIHLTE